MPIFPFKDGRIIAIGRNGEVGILLMCVLNHAKEALAHWYPVDGPGSVEDMMPAFKIKILATVSSQMHDWAYSVHC